MIIDRKKCPHCGSFWFIEEYNYSIISKMKGYKLDGKTMTIETNGKKIMSFYTDRCLACGYSINRGIKHI